MAPPFAFSMAFQPIVDLTSSGRVFGYEAVVRGTQGEAAAIVLSRVTAANRYAFDQSCRAKAIALAAALGLLAEEAFLAINYMPGAIYQPENCIRATLAAARRHGLPNSRIILEVSEEEHVRDPLHLSAITREYRRQGLLTAIDDFGSGYAGLRLLADFQPDILKLDMDLVRTVETDPARQAITRGVIGVCRDLGIRLIAEGVERQTQLDILRGMGITLFQGFLFAEPALERLPSIDFQPAPP